MSAANLRVLVVEDDPDAAEVISIVVEGLGYRCETASTVRAARNMIETYRPQVLILDDELGDGRGVDLARSLRRENRRVFIISFSGSAMDGTEFDAFLTKPVSASQLRESVRDGVSALDKRADREPECS